MHDSGVSAVKVWKHLERASVVMTSVFPQAFEIAVGSSHFFDVLASITYVHPYSEHHVYVVLSGRRV